jgi:2-oxoglutarate dehydrogenase E2 component (dihydrolipoamide succinyltransferase)
MNVSIVIPAVGESITEGVLANWTTEDGRQVTEGDTLFELETEKTTIEVPAPATGKLSITVPGGTQVRIGQTVGAIDTAAAVEAHSEEDKRDVPPKVTPDPAASSRGNSGGRPISPLAKRLLSGSTVDIAAIRGTGPGGRITKADVLAAEGQSNTAPAVTPPPEPSPAAGTARATRRVSMSPMRKATARRLAEAARTAAYVTTFNEIDMLKVMEIRSHLRDEFEQEHGTRIGFMSFFVKACCQALTAYPSVNAFVEGDEVIYNDFHDIGIAISTESGLVVPVIRDADTLHFAQIEAAITAFAQKARRKRLLPSDLEGGTFTITNGGVFGSLLSTPIPAYPQTAILGMHTIQSRPVAVGDAVVIRPMMYVALTYDHRVIDGKEAVGFLSRVKGFIEDPDKLLLEL